VKSVFILVPFPAAIIIDFIFPPLFC